MDTNGFAAVKTLNRWIVKPGNHLPSRKAPARQVDDTDDTDYLIWRAHCLPDCVRASSFANFCY